MPKLSAELFNIPLDDSSYLIYAPLRRAAFVANAAAVNFVAGLRNGELDAGADPDGRLVEFLRQLEIVDAGPETQPVTTFTGLPEPTSVTLFLTTACNLRCTYCYASAGDTPVKSMPLGVAKRGIDFVAGNAKRKGVPCFEVNYHGGGEPTVHWKVMTESLSYAREVAGRLGLTVSSSAATNGILTDEQIDWVVHNMEGVSLSFDGLPMLQDRNRPTITGRRSSERVVHTMRRFEEASFRYGVRVTVTIDDIPHLPEAVEFICGNFKVDRIQVEPAYAIGRWKDAPSAETEEFIAAFRTAQGRAAAFGRRIMFSAARLDGLTNHFCGVTQDNFTLSPDGNVSACFETFSEDLPHADRFFYGKPAGENSGYLFDLPVLNNLRRQAVQHRDYCSGCFAKWHCAGDCYHKAMATTGSAEFAGTDRCHITRELTKDQILEKIANAGGLFWHEPPAVCDTRPEGKEFLL